MQLPTRDDRGIKKLQKKHDKDVAQGRRLRESRGDSQKPPEGSSDGD